MTHAFGTHVFSPRVRLARLGRGLAWAPLAWVAGCGQYDWGDIVDGIDGDGHSPGGPHSCVVDGERYRPGDVFPAPDGCNICNCSEDGWVACTAQACIATCGGLQGSSCPAGQYCEFPPEAQCGAGDQTGLCATQPEACTREYRPVCGCDGATYGNACTAASAGVSIAHAGECTPPGECRSDADCPVPPCACLDEDGDGSCDNECPVAVCRDGVCGVGSPSALQLGEACGGFRPAGSPGCDEGLFCQHQPGALCGAADAPGECVLVPQACDDIYDPVCGCDGTTYANACEAAANRAGILERGPCR